MAEPRTPLPLTVPLPLRERLYATVPAGKRSAVICQLIAEHLDGRERSDPAEVADRLEEIMTAGGSSS